MQSFLLKALLVLAAVTGVIGVSTNDVNAQRRYNRNVYSRPQIDRLIRNVETRVDRFVSQFDNSLDNSRLNNTRREDNLNRRARDLEAATDELRREFDRSDTRRENRLEVQRCLDIATDIDRVMRRRRFDAATERNFAAVRVELNALARAYRLPVIGGAYR